MNVTGLAPFARGGMAELFSATVGGAAVLVKVPRADRAAAAAALAAEAAVLARIGGTAAPRLVGHTRIGGREALVIEHLPWPTLRGAVEGAAERLALPVPAAEADRIDRLALAIAACDAVAQVHAAGVVHGDLSPDNLLVDAAAPCVRVIDFGAAALRGDAIASICTTAYAAPERLLEGCVAGPAVDVYALGVVIYELFTGELPFGPATGACRTAHLAGRIPHIAEHVTVPAGVDAAVAAAMAKDAGARPADAGVLAVMLREARGTAPVRRFRRLRSTVTPSGLAADVRNADERPTTVIAGVWHAPLVGRAGALTTLAEAAATAGAGLSTLVTVWGEPGLGKSRLVEEARALAEGQGLDVIALPAGRVAAVRERLAADRGDADPAADADAAALEVLASGRPVVGTAAARYAAAPGAMRQAAARALARLLRGDAEAPANARAIILDDAHAADPVVLDAIELATMRPDGRVTIIVLARPALGLTRPGWGRRAARHETLRLAPLSPAEGRALARSLLPEVAAVPVAALDRLVRRCGGVPLFIGELVRSMARHGLAVRGALDTDRLDAPADAQLLEHAIDDELAALPPAVVEVAELLAVAARPMRRDQIDALIEAAEHTGVLVDVDPGAAVRDLHRAGLLLDQGPHLDFRHALVRLAIARRPPAWRQIAIHRAVLESGIVLDAAERAVHLEGCGEADAAAAAWREAADAAPYDDLAVERAMTRALACVRTPVAAILRRRAAARARLGRHDDAAADFAAARALATESGDRAEHIDALLDEATAHDWAGHHDLATTCTREASRLFDEATAPRGDAVVRRDEAAGPSGDAIARRDEIAVPPSDAVALRGARIAMAIGRAAWRRGDGGAALAPWRQALAVAEGLGEAGYPTAIACRLMLGFVLGQRGCVEQASAILDAAMQEARARGDLQHQAAVLCNRYGVHAARGDGAAVRRDMAEFTALARELGVAAMEYRGEVNQAFTAMWCDDDAAAGDHAAAAARLEHCDPGLFRRPRGALLLAELAARAGDRGTAARWLETARTHVRTVAAAPAAAAGPAAAAAPAPMPVDALMIEALAAWLRGWDARELAALADRASALGQVEVAYELYELYARDRERVGDRAGAAKAHHDARTVPPGLPRFLSAARG